METYCDYCDKEGDTSVATQPFRDHEVNLCPECLDHYAFYCDDCGRAILRSNALRSNEILVDECVLICPECYQEHAFRHGMELPEKGLPGDWFNESDLKNHGFSKHSSHHEQFVKVSELRNMIDEISQDRLWIITFVRSDMIYVQFEIWTKRKYVMVPKKQRKRNMLPHI